MDAQYLKDTMDSLNAVSQAGINSGLEMGRREAEARIRELQRRLTEITDMIDGREDIDDNQGPNIFMRIGMCARGEDRP